MLHSSLTVVSLALVVLAVCASLYITGFAALGLLLRQRTVHAQPRTRFLVLVPAHNESRGIIPTLRSLQHASYPADLLRLAVIADNCSDDTAEVARECGVEVWIRTDTRNQGKGQALSWALDKAALPFDLVAIIDADTEVDENFFAAMNAAYLAQLQKGRASVVLQGKYLFAARHSSNSWFEQFSAASKAAENAFSYRPRTALGLPNLIQGNGFCVSNGALQQVAFTASSIVEDAEYAIELALGNVPVIYVEDAIVNSRLTQNLRAAAPQRIRWAGGVFALMSHSIPRLLRSALRQRRWQLAEMAFMLALTSRLLLIYTTLLAVVLLDLAYPFHGFRYAVAGLIAAILLQGVYLYLVMRRAHSSPIPLQAIALMPFYVGFLGVMQLGAVLGVRRHTWTRTVR
jgi:1,2-diacylglycerol 3-beta-glucosyltransferase